MSREPHAADGRPENIGILLERTVDLSTIRQQQLQRKHMRAESAVDVVVLSVDISGHRSAQGHELRARHNRREPSPRQKGLDDFS
jgi:hypothetical protein